MSSASVLRARLGRVVAELRAGRQDLRAVRAETAQLTAAVTELHAATARLERRMDSGQLTSEVRHNALLTALKRIHADEARHRRALRVLREAEGYDLAFTEPAPLVSVVIATYERLRRLREVVIPSILAQEYPNVEIVIVGDDAPYGEVEVTEGFGDAPIRFVNLPMRGPYPEDRQKLWMVAGSVPFNEGMRLARGRWIALFSDDDVMRPHQIRTLVTSAQERRLEVVYGKILDHQLGRPLGVFPPRWGDFALQASVIHASLRRFEFEIADADFDTPNDMGLMDRLLRAGARFGMVDDVVADYYPSMRGNWVPARTELPADGSA